MKLYTQTSGAGPDLVLVHGWGLHGGIWERLLPYLEPAFRITRVDLPGHGRSAWNDEDSLSDMAAAVLSVAPPRSDWLGWSLGSLVTIQAAWTAPARIRQLVLLAGTPCFVCKPDWPVAMEPELLDAFATGLQEDYAATLNRFLALQVHGSEEAGTVLRELRARVLEQGKPDTAALLAGLGILRDSDLRKQLRQLEQRMLFLMGSRDTLVPAAAGRQAAALAADARSRVIDGAGHAPFIARPEEVATAVRTFLSGEKTFPAVGEGHA
jgi:pimeloyl-[acyl-carrier protein] methyl ester esterase